MSKQYNFVFWFMPQTATNYELLVFNYDKRYKSSAEVFQVHF